MSATGTSSDFPHPIIEMRSFHRHTGLVVPLKRANVDTDQIIPKQFLKRIERIGFGEFLFYDWRYTDDGSLNPKFVLNKKRYKGAKILLARDNFGSGSSRHSTRNMKRPLEIKMSMVLS